MYITLSFITENITMAMCISIILLVFIYKKQPAVLEIVFFCHYRFDTLIEQDDGIFVLQHFSEEQLIKTAVYINIM